MILKKRQNRQFHITLSKGLQVHVEELSIPVAIRIDKGPIIERRRLLWTPQTRSRRYHLTSTIPRQATSPPTLTRSRHGQRVAIQVEDERGHIQLDGSRSAVEDFRRRAGLNLSRLDHSAHPTLAIKYPTRAHDEIVLLRPRQCKNNGPFRFLCLWLRWQGLK